MPSRWRLFLLGGFLVIAGGGLASSVQTAGGIVIEDVRFEFEPGKNLAAHVYRPPNASESAPAPGILAVHGYINSRETQSGFAIEFARRGYVVLAIDQTGHGFSDGVAFSHGYGGPAALRFLRTLAYVDKENIGLTGHSMGGWTGLSAAASMPDAYRSVALVGSSTGPGFAPEGSIEFPRNLGVVFSRYDEFAELMWGVERAVDVINSDKLKAVFGTDRSIERGVVYGDIETGSARWLATPATTHPGDHISPSAIADTLRWMAMTLKGGQPFDETDQIWHWKELGTLVALIGGFLLLLGSIELMLGWNVFRGLHSPGEGVVDAMNGRWLLGLLLTSAIPAATYYPLTAWGAVVEPTALFPQGVTNRILVWAMANAAIAALLMLVLRPAPRLAAGAEVKSVDRSRTIALALLTVGVVYVAVALSATLTQTDFRFWVVALKPMAPRHVAPFLAYLPFFILFFYLTQRAWFSGYSLRGRAPLQYLTTVIAAVEVFTLMIIAVYAWLFANGQLPGVDPLFSIIAIQFIPVLTVTAVISVFAWRRTGDVLLGSMICGLLVSWYVVAGQATQV